MVDKLDYALLANRAYPRTKINTTPLDGLDWRSDWTELQAPENTPITGFSAGVYKNGNDIVIAFTGTDELQWMTIWKDWAGGNLPAGFGLPAGQIFQAAELVMQVMADYPGEDINISFTGHSLGGAFSRPWRASPAEVAAP